MGSGIFYPAANGDDGGWSSLAWYANESALYLGNFASVGWNVFVRFVDVVIPAGSVIDSAIIKFTCTDTPQSGTAVLTDCYFNDIDDAVAPTSIGEGNGLSLTGLIAWDNLPAWSAGVQYSTPELKTILQTVIDRDGWSSGNAAMVIVLDDGSSANAERDAENYYYNPTKKAELHVTWSDAAGPEESITDVLSDISAVRSKWWLNTDIQATTWYPDRERFLMVRHNHVPIRDEQNVLIGKAMQFRLYNPDAELGIDLTTFKIRFNEGVWYRYGDSRLTFTEVNSAECLVYFNPPNFTYNSEVMIEIYCEDKANNPGIKLEIL